MKSTLKAPTPDEIAALESPAQQFIVQAHMDAGRVEFAVLAYLMGKEAFAQADEQMRAAFILGAATAMSKRD